MGAILDLLRNNNGLANTLGVALAIAIPGLVLFFWKRGQSLGPHDTEKERDE